MYNLDYYIRHRYNSLRRAADDGKYCGTKYRKHSGNLAAEFEDEDSWDSEFGTYYDDIQEIADGFRSLTDDIGSHFVPDEEMMEIYHGNS